MTFRLEGVVAGYGDAPVLHEVDLIVPAASVVALLGPNGAGKTSLLRAASGLLPLTRGRLSIDDVDLTGRSVDFFARSGVRHIPEGRSVFPGMTVRENLVLYSPRGRETESMARAVDAFPVLGRRLNQRAGTMSGGEQQMLAIARSSVSDPRVVLVDEVSLGLAPMVVDEIFAFLHTIAEAGTSLLLVEQYVARALELADYLYVLGRGRIVFAGEPDELGRQDLLEQYLGEMPV